MFLKTHAFPIFVTGPAGTGKSCVGRLCVERLGGQAVVFRHAFADHLAASRGELERGPKHFPYRVSERELWRGWEETPCLVVDEVAKRETASAAERDFIHNLLDLREGRPMLVISNRPLSEIKTIYDGAIGSRIGGGTQIKIAGRDRRLDGERPCVQRAPDPTADLPLAQRVEVWRKQLRYERTVLHGERWNLWQTLTHQQREAVMNRAKHKTASLWWKRQPMPDLDNPSYDDLMWAEFELKAEAGGQA